MSWVLPQETRPKKAEVVLPKVLDLSLRISVNFWKLVSLASRPTFPGQSISRHTKPCKILRILMSCRAQGLNLQVQYPNPRPSPRFWSETKFRANLKKLTFQAWLAPSPKFADSSATALSFWKTPFFVGDVSGWSVIYLKTSPPF